MNRVEGDLMSRPSHCTGRTGLVSGATLIVSKNDSIFGIVDKISK